MSAFILGLLTAVVFFIALIGAYLLGLRHKKKEIAPIPLDEEKQRQLEVWDKGFREIFSYDVAKALQKKKVT
jgi:hypothetical protein